MRGEPFFFTVCSGLRMRFPKPCPALPRFRNPFRCVVLVGGSAGSRCGFAERAAESPSRSDDADADAGAGGIGCSEIALSAASAARGKHVGCRQVCQAAENCCRSGCRWTLCEYGHVGAALLADSPISKPALWRKTDLLGTGIYCVPDTDSAVGAAVGSGTGVGTPAVGNTASENWTRRNSPPRVEKAIGPSLAYTAGAGRQPVEADYAVSRTHWAAA